MDPKFKIREYNKHFIFHIEFIFQKLPIVEFWNSIKEYPWLSEKANIILLPFPTTYLGDAGFFSHILQPKQPNKEILFLSDVINYVFKMSQFGLSSVW